MKNNYTVERMTKNEVHLAVAWAAEEGWNPGLNDAECFYQTDPHGFFAGKLDGKIIAVGSAIIYDEHFAFCGFYIVDKAYRGQGFGLQLTRHRLNYVGKRNAGIDGVTNMLDKYARLGYKFAHHNARYECTRFFSSHEHPHIIPLAQANFSELMQYDRRHFPAPRETFLRCWINQPGARSLAYIQEDKLSGYGVIRPCIRGFKIGPLFADNPGIADKLFLQLANHAMGQPFYLDIPENNPNAIHLVKRYDLQKVFETARMYLKGEPTLETRHIYGITSFELG
ncbi:GNAT family N-acetyltransferase [Legionella londiniensis]|uniref:GNAT family acetyltransferase n=1 Tax=Legionella londiniensis TaxID=45068 RepID=A0A0W0VTP5_9GAMM|nr:GNAT family N-acetyltransferase [Legionella londiniensis]KTD23046.1 GNAT family acetyltransferase [Legionella londiniensis]STX94063.1 acetyltransferase, GNAT family [Legionella londiniensis]